MQIATQTQREKLQHKATDLVLEFLEATLHEFLFVWQVYPPGSFERRVLYEVPIHQNRHPLLCDYVHSMLQGCREWILRDQLAKLCMIVLSKQGNPLTTLVFEMSWTKPFLLQACNASSDSADQPASDLPRVQMQEAFRSMLVKMIASSIADSTGCSAASDEEHQLDDSVKAHTFRILAHTVEEASMPATIVDATNVKNSWVVADRFWHEQQLQQERYALIQPIRSICEDSLPFQMQLYLKKEDTKSNKTECHRTESESAR